MSFKAANLKKQARKKKMALHWPRDFDSRANDFFLFVSCQTVKKKSWLCASDSTQSATFRPSD